MLENFKIKTVFILSTRDKNNCAISEKKSEIRFKMENLL